MVRSCVIATLIFFGLSTESAATPRGDGFAADTVVRGALREAFDGGGSEGLAITYRPVLLDSATRAAITASTKSPFPDDTLRVYACARGGAIAGFGVMDNVTGKSRAITYLVILTPAGEVSGIEILVYRESHGGEIASASFRGQFTGKKPGDRLVPGRDIRTISGATISSRSLTAGVAKVIAAFSAIKAGL